MAEQSLVGQTLGVYELVRRIGEGAGGAVYEARSTEAGPAGPAGSRVAVKAVHPELIEDERLLQRFQREAALGMRIRNPHLVPTYACDEDTIDGVTYAWLAMQYVEGETLRETLSKLRVVPEPLLYLIADQVLDALGAIHAEGMIHRDIKPENVLITPAREILVMDLGVARLQQEGRDLTHAGEFVGSLVYAAPEQFTDQDAVGPAADLYAVGVVLYELATGVSPFDAGDLHGLIGQKLRSAPRRPKSWNRDLDPFLDDVILSCLRTDADERFASADALRQVLRDGTSGPWWARRTEGGVFDASRKALEALAVPRTTPLLGRARELGALHAAYAGAARERASIVLVRSPAGVGKTRLVHDFLEELVAPEGPRIVTQREDTAAAAADAGRTLVVVCDDAHEADADRVAAWRQQVDAVDDRPTLFVFAYRPDALADDAPLAEAAAAWSEHQLAATIDLEPLATGDTRRLLKEVLGAPRTVRALSGPLGRTCAGNPHFLLEAIAHLKATGALDAGDEGWAPVRPIHEVELPDSLRGLFAQRLEQLDRELLDVLEAASVQGPAFESGLLVAVTGQRRIRLLKHLGRLERRHRLVQGVAKGRYRFADPGLQRVVYERLEPERRAALHAASADALGASPAGAGAYALVRHLLAAGRFEDAAGHVAEAARHAVASAHPSEAIPFFESLAAGLPDAAHAARFEAYMALAELLRLGAAARPYRDALESAAAVAAQSGDPGLAARSEAACGRAAWRAGDVDAAEDHATRGRELAAASNDAASHARCAEILGLVAFRRGDTERAEAAWTDAGQAWSAVGRSAEEARVLLRLAELPGPADDPERPLETARRALAMLQEAGDARGEGAALRTLGRALAERGRYPEALKAFEQALSLAQARGDQPGEADVLAARARIHTVEGEWETARADLEQALDIFRALDDPSGEARTLDALGMAYATFGEPGTAAETLRTAAEVAARSRERPLLARVLRHLGTLEHQAGRRAEAWARFEEALTHAQGHARSLVYADMGSAAERERDPDRAVDLLRRSLDAAERETDEVLTRCRLARAHMGGGRWDEARAEAERVEDVIGTGDAVLPQHAPEVFFSLGSVLVTEARGREYLERASRLVNEQVRSIKSIVSRDRFLTMRWPNPEIFEAMRRLDA